MAATLTTTDFDFKGQKSLYHGKVRDVYDIDDKYLVMVATDRISAFDVILPKGIPFKGQVLNQIAAYFLDATSDNRHQVRAPQDRDDRARIPRRLRMARVQGRST